MKRLIALLLLAVASVAMAQNLERSYTGTASQDTLKDLSFWKASQDSGNVKKLVSITVNAPVASDSIFIFEGSRPSGARYLAKIIIPSTAPPPFTLFYNCVVDSGFVIIKRYKTSDVTVVYSRSPY